MLDSMQIQQADKKMRITRERMRLWSFATGIMIWLFAVMVWSDGATFVAAVLLGIGSGSILNGVIPYE